MAEMFHDVLFPKAISYGSKGGPKFLTQIVTLASGKERRNIAWSQVRAEYDVSHGIKEAGQMSELREFFYARMGQAYSFRFFDHADNQIMEQQIASYDALNPTLKKFQIYKSYVSGANQYVRKITKIDSTRDFILKIQPDVGSPTYLTSPANFVLNYGTGEVTLTNALTSGQNLVVEFAVFHVHVRFGIDHFDPEHDFWQVESWPSIPLFEIKE